MCIDSIKRKTCCEPRKTDANDGRVVTFTFNVLRRRPTEWGVGGLSYRFWYAKSCPWQAFSRLCAVIATVGYAHRVPTLEEGGVGKHPPF